MTIALILISLFAIFQWWRKRVWRKRFRIAISEEGIKIIHAYAQMQYGPIVLPAKKQIH